MTSETPIPQSNALEEADTFSLTELMSRDPHGFQRQDRDKIVAALRVQRKKWEEVEAAGGHKRGANPKIGTKSLETKATPEDLGL